MSCTNNCQQGKTCTCRLYTLNTDGSDSNAPRQWLQGVAVNAVYAVGIVAAVVVLAGFADYFWGKHV